MIGPRVDAGGVAHVGPTTFAFGRQDVWIEFVASVVLTPGPDGSLLRAPLNISRRKRTGPWRKMMTNVFDMPHRRAVTPPRIVRIQQAVVCLQRERQRLSGNVCDTSEPMTVVVMAHRSSGRSPFARWFDGLNAAGSQRRSRRALTRMEVGQFSNVEGRRRRRIRVADDFGPGYRVYFGKDGDTLVILVAGADPRSISKTISRRLRTGGRIYERRKARSNDMSPDPGFQADGQNRIARDPRQDARCCAEGVECLLAGDLDTGKSILRDYINVDASASKNSAS